GRLVPEVPLPSRGGERIRRLGPRSGPSRSWRGEALALRALRPPRYPSPSYANPLRGQASLSSPLARGEEAQALLPARRLGLGRRLGPLFRLPRARRRGGQLEGQRVVLDAHVNLAAAGQLA